MGDRYVVKLETIKERDDKPVHNYSVVDSLTENVVARYGNKDTAEEIVYRLNGAQP